MLQSPKTDSKIHQNASVIRAVQAPSPDPTPVNLTILNITALPIEKF